MFKIFFFLKKQLGFKTLKFEKNLFYKIKI